MMLQVRGELVFDAVRVEVNYISQNQGADDHRYGFSKPARAGT